LRSIVRRDSGETYQEFLTRLAQASGIETPTRADLARLDRTRPKKGRNTDWRHPHDHDARITKMKDGRTHLAHKAEHAVDMETGAIVGVTVQGADQGDTTTSVCESSAHPWRARRDVAAATERTPRTAECASLRDRRDAPHPPAGARQHPQTIARPHGGLQFGLAHTDLKGYVMSVGLDTNEVCPTVADVAKRLKIDGDTVRRSFLMSQASS
jgi:hypothetical protein